MAQLKIVYWRDIPGQVVFKEGRRNIRFAIVGDVKEQAQLLVRQLEEQYPDVVLEQLTRASGRDETRALNF